MSLSNGLKAKISSLGKSSTTKVWVPQPQKRQRSTSPRLRSIKLSLNMSTTRTTMLLSLPSTKKWLTAERNGSQPTQCTTTWIIQRSISDTRTSSIRNSFSSQLLTAQDPSPHFVMAWNLGRERFFLLALKENSKVKSRLHSWVVMLPSTQPIITVSSLCVRRLSPWLKILLEVIMSIFYCLLDSLVPGTKEAKRRHLQDTFSQVLVK